MAQGAPHQHPSLCSQTRVERCGDLCKIFRPSATLRSPWPPPLHRCRAVQTTLLSVPAQNTPVTSLRLPSGTRTESSCQAMPSTSRRRRVSATRLSSHRQRYLSCACNRQHRPCGRMSSIFGQRAERLLSLSRSSACALPSLALAVLCCASRGSFPQTFAWTLLCVSVCVGCV